KGIKAGAAYKSEVAGHKIVMVALDDASDPSTAARNARKLIEEDKVDVIIGTAGSPGALAIAAVARETKTPLISIANANLPGEEGAWMVTLPQPAPLMVSAVVERMKASGVKSVGYIGFSDAWGDLVYDALQKSAGPAGIKVIGNERYARADTSVAGQVLKIVAQKPDAVITGTSGTPGALPYLALAERGYKGQIYGTHALINPDFVRVGGASVEGLLAPTGPVIVAEQLPESNPMRKVAMDFRAAYQKANGAAPTDAFSAYSFDGWLLMLDAASRTKGEPGTPAYRVALRDAIVSTKELVGTHSVYNFKPDNRYGSDDRSRVIVKLEKGQWKLVN
ncbi:MAG TPA: ABC transporter substrate-binding protein, partial [Variovorax sp.]|nr:ABC transporter substrate-binding protein [Variovorax sp.]